MAATLPKGLEEQRATLPKTEHDRSRWWHELIAIIAAFVIAGGSGPDKDAKDVCNPLGCIPAALVYWLFYLTMCFMAFYGKWYDSKNCPHHEIVNFHCGGITGVILCFAMFFVMPAILAPFLAVSAFQVVGEIVDYCTHMFFAIAPILVVNILCTCCAAATTSQVADMRAEIKFNRRKLGTKAYIIAYAPVMCNGLKRLPLNICHPKYAPVFWNAVFTTMTNEPWMRSCATMWFCFRLLIVFICNCLAGPQRLLLQLRYCWDQKQRLSRTEFGLDDPLKIKLMKMAMGLPAITLRYPGFKIPGLNWPLIADKLPPPPGIEWDNPDLPIVAYLKFLGITNTIDFWSTLPDLPLAALPAIRVPKGTKVPTIKNPNLDWSNPDLAPLKAFQVQGGFNNPAFGDYAFDIGSTIVYPPIPINGFGINTIFEVLCDGISEGIGALMAIPFLLLEANHVTNLTLNRHYFEKDDPVTQIMKDAEAVKTALEDAKRVRDNPILAVKL